MNATPFTYVACNGTSFSARSDFRDGVQVLDVPKDKFQFGVDVAEMVGYHMANIWPSLNGFQGYDTIRFIEAIETEPENG